MWPSNKILGKHNLPAVITFAWEESFAQAYPIQGATVPQTDTLPESVVKFRKLTSQCIVQLYKHFKILPELTSV